MDFFNEILNSTDIVLVGSIIFIIQFIKEFLKNRGFLIHSDIWKIIVFVMGIGAAFLSFPLNEISFTWPMFIKSAFVYASASTFLYQTGKLSIKKITNKEETNDKISNGN